MNIIFMGTPLFACPTLHALITEKFNVTAVYTQPPRPAGRGYKEQLSAIHQLALDNDLKVETPKSLRNIEAQNEFFSHQPDIAIVAAYGLILPKAIVDFPKFGCINIHPSSLPRWRGAAPIQHTILAGDTKTSVCIMQMDEGLDTGDVLLQKDFAVPENFTSGELHDFTANLGAKMVLETLSNLSNLKATKQPSENVTYASKITKEHARIDWSNSAIEIDRQVRGFQSLAYCAFYAG